jgi:hypothetical protein
MGTDSMKALSMYFVDHAHGRGLQNRGIYVIFRYKFQLKIFMEETNEKSNDFFQHSGLGAAYFYHRLLPAFR